MQDILFVHSQGFDLNMLLVALCFFCVANSAERATTAQLLDFFLSVSGARVDGVELRDVPGKGKGLIASRDLKANEMLLFAPSSLSISPKHVLDHFPEWKSMQVQSPGFFVSRFSFLFFFLFFDFFFFFFQSKLSSVKTFWLLCFLPWNGFIWLTTLG